MAIITLTEGVRQGDLEYMVSQFISIDQYSTKINNDNIVVSFFVKEQDAATDMGDFLSKNFFDIINDIEVSDSPTCNGDYQVFLEMERNKYFPEKLCKITKILELLTGEQDSRHSKRNVRSRWQKKISNWRLICILKTTPKNPKTVSLMSRCSARLNILK